VPVVNNQNIQTKLFVPLPNCKLSDVMKYVTDQEYRLKFDGDSITKITTTQTYPMETT